MKNSRKHEIFSKYEFWKQVNQLRVEDLIFIDESGVNLAMVRLYARSLKGSRALGSRPNRRGRNGEHPGFVNE